MITTPPGYNAYPPTRKVEAGAEFEIITQGTAEAAAATAAHADAPSQIQQTHNSKITPSTRLGSLDKNFWILDGSIMVMPQNLTGYETGYWSNVLSDATGVLQTPPTVTLSFNQPVSSYGFTLFFDGKFPDEHPTCVEIAAKNGSTVLLRKRYNVQGCQFAATDPVQNYTEVTITFHNTALPYRRVRLTEVIFGLIYAYTQSDLTKMEVLTQIDPMALSLPESTIAVTVNNIDKTYNLANPAGVFRYLQEGQRITSRITIDGDDVHTGDYYYTGASSSDGALTATIRGADKMSALDDSLFDTGETGTWTLSQAVTAILAKAGVVWSVDIPSDLNEEIRKCVPVNTRCREALRMAAQAARCTCFFDRTGVLRFRRLTIGTPAETVSRGAMHSDAQITISNTYNSVLVVQKDAFAGATRYFEASDIQPGDYKRQIEISNPLARSAGLARWLLDWFKMRTIYQVKTRGNPAIETGDTVRMQDGYGGAYPVIVTKEVLRFDGGLNADMTGRR